MTRHADLRHRLALSVASVVQSGATCLRSYFRDARARHVSDYGRLARGVGGPRPLRTEVNSESAAAAVERLRLVCGSRSGRQSRSIRDALPRVIPSPESATALQMHAAQPAIDAACGHFVQLPGDQSLRRRLAERLPGVFCYRVLWLADSLPGFQQ